jgi:hypothetical protein
MCVPYIKLPLIKHCPDFPIRYRGPRRGGPSSLPDPSSVVPPTILLVMGPRCGHCDTSRRSRRGCICLLLSRIIRSVIFVLVIARIVLLTTVYRLLLCVIVLRSAVSVSGRVLSGVSTTVVAILITSRGCDRLIARSHGQDVGGFCGLASSHHADDAECAEAAYENTDHCVQCVSVNSCHFKA